MSYSAHLTELEAHHAGPPGDIKTDTDTSVLVLAQLLYTTKL